MGNIATTRRPGTIERGVLFGHDGELFLADGGHNVLAIATGTLQVPAAMFGIFEANLNARSAFCQALGVAYAHVIFPDKQSVVRDRFPFPDPVCLGTLYQQRCPSLGGLLINLTDVLRAAPARVFRRTDTHNADFGMAVCAARLAAILAGVDEAAVLASLLARPERVQMVSGDLGQRFDPPLCAEEHLVAFDQPARSLHNDVGFGNDGMIDIHLSPGASSRSRLLWFGDSFGRGCAKVLSCVFQEVTFMRTRFLHQEIVRQIRPDIVVTQNVERYLDRVAPDDEAPPFLLYPALKGLQSAPNASFVSALCALLSYPRPPFARFMAEAGMPPHPATP